jgi:hypothetical protein
LDIAAQKLVKLAGRLDVAWGDLYRLRRGKTDLPANGAGDLLGTFRIIDYEMAKDGRFVSEGGDNFITAAEFSAPIRAKVLLTGGNSDTMGKIKWTRVVLRGLLAGAIINVFEFVANGVFLAAE